MIRTRRAASGHVLVDSPVGAIEDCPKGTTTRWYRKDLLVAIRPAAETG